MNSIVKILLLFIALSSCSGSGDGLKVPEDVIPRDSMISALVDMHLIEGAKIGQKVMGDTLKINTYYAKLYSKYGVSEKEFEKSFRFYSEHPGEMNKMYQEVIERLNKIQQEPPRTPLVEKTDTTPKPRAIDTLMTGRPLNTSRLKDTITDTLAN